LDDRRRGLFNPLLARSSTFGKSVSYALTWSSPWGGLAYALMLVGQVMKAPQGTKKMQEIAQAVREGANAYCIASSAWWAC